ncbi:MAG TPA: DUF4097 family beta strand repeat-containing protein [Rhodanobacteraceae bacterium]|nr:DUF4097 family beta strand repeat-containing protein [Rhodanobacteraceae bacterium]
MPTRHRIIPTLLAFALLGGSAAAMAQAPANTHTRTIDKTEAVTPATQVTVENLVGRVEITQGGEQLAIHANVVAGGEDAAAAEALANTVKLDVSRDGNRLTVHVNYPVDDHDSYRYIPTSSKPGQHKDCSVHILGFRIGSCSSSSWLRYQGRQVHVYQGRDEGVPLHVDLTLKLPAGADVKVVNQIGFVHAKGLHNTLALQTDSGDISTSDTSGDLRITADSGDVQTVDHKGPATLHTDSGDVTLRHVTGNINVDTDSGDLTGEDLHGAVLALHTDNGDIRLHGISGELKISTDSGDIDLSHVQQVSRTRINTDNGDIRMSGDLSGMHDFHIATDSGDIRLSTSTPPAVHLDIEADDVDVTWPGLHNVQIQHDSYRGDVGAASGSGRISTDSGDVTLSR